MPRRINTQICLFGFLFSVSKSLKNRRLIISSLIILQSLILGSILPISASANSLTLSASQSPPYHTPDLKGLEDQIALEIYRRLGYSVTIYDAPAARALILLNDGIDDGALARNPNMQQRFPNLVQFSEHVLEREYVAFTKSPWVKIDGWESLENYTVGIVNGWKILERNITNSKDLIKVRDGTQLFKILDAGRVEIVVFNKWGGLQLIRDLDLKDVRPVMPSLAAKKVYFYLHKRHADLAEDASEILRELKRDGTYDRLTQETLNPLNNLLSKRTAKRVWP